MLNFKQESQELYDAFQSYLEILIAYDQLNVEKMRIDGILDKHDIDINEEDTIGSQDLAFNIKDKIISQMTQDVLITVKQIIRHIRLIIIEHNDKYSTSTEIIEHYNIKKNIQFIILEDMDVLLADILAYEVIYNDIEYLKAKYDIEVKAIISNISDQFNKLRDHEYDEITILDDPMNITSVETTIDIFEWHNEVM